MPIATTCDSCQTTFRVKDEHAGKRGTCPKCKAPVEVPSATAPVPPTRSGPPTRQELMEEILKAFAGDIAPVKRTVGYFIGSLVLAVAMLVLPALYLALLAG